MVTTLQKTATLYWSSVPTPMGTCVAMATEKGVCWTGTPGTTTDWGLGWVKRHMPVESVIEGEEVTPLQQAMDELRRYFAGEHLQFSCPLDLRGTPVESAVSHALFRIPYGETRSYGVSARAIKRPAAVRAVGAANGANPVA